MKLFPRFQKRGSGFANAMVASFPDGLMPPEPLIKYFNWLEAAKADRLQNGMRFALIDPEQGDLSMLVEPVDPNFAVAWIGEDVPSISGRIAAFVRTGGDGSYAGLWRDDEGGLRFVHQGSGSGSTMLCTLTDDPIDFLRLLAVGYEELCWPEVLHKTPEEVHIEHLAENPGLGPFKPRRAMRDWVEATFGVIVPARASDIVTSIAEMDQAKSDDPFWKWIRVAQGWDG